MIFLIFIFLYFKFYIHFVNINSQFFLIVFPCYSLDKIQKINTIRKLLRENSFAVFYFHNHSSSFMPLFTLNSPYSPAGDQ